MRSEILRLLDNTFTGNYEYGRSNEEKLPLPIQIKLSKKLQTFCHLFFAFFLSTWNFQYSEKKKKKKKKKKMNHKRSNVPEVIDSKICAYLNA